MVKARIVIATRNQGKIEEYHAMLADLDVRLMSLDEAGISFDVEEIGSSFAENAILKASAYAKASGYCALADDSGLEVDALGGEPGVFSSRYAGQGANDAEKVRFLLSKLTNIPKDQRSARFRCVLALSTPAGDVHTTEGTCEGKIAFAPRGQYGFGYDPVFYLPEFNQTMAEVSPDFKNQISHRSKALQNARPLIATMINEGHCST